MVKDIDIVPSGDVQQGALGQEVETGLRKLHSPFPAEHRVQPGLERVKMNEDVGGGINDLFRRKLGRPPVRALLGLAEVNRSRAIP